MRPATFLGVSVVTAWAVLAASAILPRPAQAQFVQPVQVSAAASTTTLDGTLTYAQKDVRANAFIASNRTLDGGAGLFSFISDNDSCIKPGTYGSTYFCAEQDRMKFYGTVWMPTAVMQAPTCADNQNCRFEATTGYWFGVKPSADISNCTSGPQGSEGGLRAYSVDHTLRYCNGSTVQQVAMRSSWSASLDFAAVPAGACSDMTITATGATKDEPALCGGCGSALGGDSSLSCSCAFTADNVATVRLCCTSGSSCADLPAITFTATALR